jgi:heme oxygenase
MDLQRLRCMTASDHERVERLMPLMEPSLTPQQYVAVLLALYGFVRGWEDWAVLNAPGDLRSAVLSRCRSGLLAMDLAHFNVPFPPRLCTPRLSIPVARPAFLGTMYVMEGSTLGGQYIAHHVEQALHLQRGEGNAYFVGHGPRTGPMWREFQQLLLAVPEADEPALIAAARDAFTSFGDWIQSACAPVPPEALSGQEHYA